MNDTPSGLAPCPACGTPMNATEPCPHCGRPPHPYAARLIAVDAALAAIAPKLETTRKLFNDLTQRWNKLTAERHELARQLYAPGRTRLADVPVAAPVGRSNERTEPVAVRKEPKELREPQTIQNLLFIIGGILLGVGAIVFTVVAWNRYGMAGRILILAIATLIAFTIPLIAMRNKLQATAETFTAIALLLLGLDGVGLWRLDTFGLRDRFAATTYTAVVFAIVAAVAYGYGRVVRLTGPRFVAIILAQPVVPLLVLPRHPNEALGAAVFTLVAALDFLAVGYFRSRTKATTILAAVVASLMLFVGSLSAFNALLADDRVGPLALAALAVVGAAAVLIAVGAQIRDVDGRAVLVAAGAIEIVVAIARTAWVAWDGHAMYIAAGLTALAVAVASALRCRPLFAAGTAGAAWLVAGLTALVSTAYAVNDVAGRAARLGPAWHSNLHRLTADPLGPDIPLAICVAYLGCALLAGKGERRWVTLLGAAPFVLALGSQAGARWWTPSILDVLGAMALVIIAGHHLTERFTKQGESRMARPAARPATVAFLGAAALAVFAVIGSLSRPDFTGAILFAVVVIGVWAAFALRRNAVMSGGALAAAIVALPFAAASLTAAYTTGPVTAMRVSMAAIAVEVVALLAIRRITHLRRYATTALTIVTIVVSASPLVIPSSERLNLYAMTGRLLIALAVLSVGMRGRTARRAMIPGDLLGLLAIGRIVPIAFTVLLQPYAWLAHIWDGNPHAVGIAPFAGQSRLDTLDIVTAVLFAASLTVSGVAMRGRRGAYVLGAPTGALALLVALIATGASWPVVPLVSLVLGLAGLFTALGPWTAARSVTVASCGALLAGAGLAGLLATKATTMGGLGAVVVVSLVLGAAGRAVVIRAGGWVAAVVFADLLAVAAILGGGAGLDDVSFGILGAAALASLAGPLIRRYGRAEVELAAIDAIVHGSVFVALAMSGTLVHAAIVVSAWGVLIGVRARAALEPWTQRKLTIVGCGLEIVAWWLLAADRGTHTVDIYTVPFAVYAYLTGAYVYRRLPALGSWVTFGPGLLAGFLPSLVLALVPDPSIGRRLIIGIVAVAVVLVGARHRWHAHVIIGGWVAVILALREIVLVWQRLSAWIPLSVAGLLIITVAITYERRRRDWARIRASLKGMV